MSYQSEKFNQARRALMLPHSRGESESIANAFHEISLALHHFDHTNLEPNFPIDHLRKLKKYMETKEVQDPNGRGAWAINADEYSTDDKIEISNAVDELAWWFSEYS